MEPRWLSVRTAAIYMDCRPSTIRAWVNENIIPAVRISRRNPAGVGRHRCTVKIDKLALDAFLQRRQS
jgi:excisionase family DNA binding protein